MSLLRALVRLAGLALLLLAFLAGAFEITAPGKRGERPLFMPAGQVAFAHWPDRLVQARVAMDNRYGPEVWDTFVAPALKLPGWLLFGLPGVALLLLARWRLRDQDGDAFSDEQSLYLFDELTKAARKDGFAEEEADIYSDGAKDIHGSWKDEDRQHPDQGRDDRDATPPHRPPPTTFGRH